MSNTYIAQFHGLPIQSQPTPLWEWRPPAYLVGLVEPTYREAKVVDCFIHIIPVSRCDLDALTCPPPAGHRGTWWYPDSLLPPNVTVNVGDLVVWAVYEDQIVEVGRVEELIGPADRRWCSGVNNRGIAWETAEVDIGGRVKLVGGVHWTKEGIEKVLKIYNPPLSLVSAIVARLCDSHSS